MIPSTDEFGRRGPQKAARKPLGDEPGSQSGTQTDPASMAQEARDSTNESLYEKGMIEPEDL